MKAAITAIDPGMTGAIAFLAADGSLIDVVDMPVFAVTKRVSGKDRMKSHINVHDLGSVIAQHGVGAAAVVEQVVDAPQPDCRAVLVPHGVNRDLADVCRLLGITIIDMPAPTSSRAQYGNSFLPTLPVLGAQWDSRKWYERCPVKRIPLPDWVPDVVAGASAPVALTPWKIGAIKLVVTLDRRGYLTRGDFKHFEISMSRWTQEKWLVKDGRGGWLAGPYLPDFKAQHPVNFDQIAADFEKWKSPETASQPGLFSGAIA